MVLELLSVLTVVVDPQTHTGGTKLNTVIRGHTNEHKQTREDLSIVVSVNILVMML